MAHFEGQPGNEEENLKAEVAAAEERLAEARAKLRQFELEKLGVPEEQKENKERDKLYEDAVLLSLEFGKASSHLFQTRLKLGYGDASKLMGRLQEDGIIDKKSGEILKRPDWIK